jgi:hypothetical protein
VLTEIEAKVAEYNARQQARMIKQSQGSQEAHFIDGSIATLWIPKKIQLQTEIERIAVRILSSNHRAYKLMSQHSRISGRFPADELNSVGNHVNLGNDIPMEPEFKAGKEVIVPFSAVIARENNRGSITSAQAAGRASGSGSGPQQPPVRVSPILEPEPEPEPALGPDPAKRTRKRRALDGVGDVDMGPRKLRNRK